MPPSPQTPQHSRHSSSVEVAYRYSPSARRHSRSSNNEPTTPMRNSLNADGLDMAAFTGGGHVASNGMGNLADELADAFSDSDVGDEYYGDDTLGLNMKDAQNRGSMDGIRDSGVDVADGERSKPSCGLTLPSPTKMGHIRKSSEYDGSEYGSSSDLETCGMPSGLIVKMDAVEALARRGRETNGGSADTVFERVTEGLKELGSQAGVEGSATRLITAHSALTTHLAHQTRLIHNLTYPLLSPLVPSPEAESIDELLPLLIKLSESMPRPVTKAYDSLAALHSLTADLISSLNYLSDTLHMSRQTTTTATRRLKSAKELVAEMKREGELCDEAERWLTRGKWSERLEKRECASVCGDVVTGFEEVCNEWRARLQEQAGISPA